HISLKCVVPKYHIDRFKNWRFIGFTPLDENVYLVRVKRLAVAKNGVSSIFVIASDEIDREAIIHADVTLIPVNDVTQNITLCSGEFIGPIYRNYNMTFDRAVKGAQVFVANDFVTLGLENEISS